MGNLGWREGGSKIQRRGQEISFLKILQVDSCLWKESKWENADKEVVELYNRDKERICAKEEKGVLIVLIVKREEIHEFTEEQLRKWYLRPSKLPQMTLVFFVGKKNGKKQIV